MSTSKDFEVFDSDSHVVEPREVWEKYLEPEYRVLGKHALWREEGRYDSYLKINGQVFRDTGNSNIPRHAIWKPGMTWDSIGEFDPNIRHPMIEGAWDPHARLRDMDAMGIDRAFLYPTWFAEGFHLVEDPDVSYALARAYNNWMTDFCQAAPDRLFAAAMVPLGNMDFAITELRRASEIRCFRGAFIRPMFMEGRYLTHPYYDPLWGELESLGMTAAVHPTAGLWNPEWTSHGPFMEKVKGRLTQTPALTRRGRRPPRGRRYRRVQSCIAGVGDGPIGAPAGSDFVPLAGQPPVRCNHVDRLYRDAAVPRYEGRHGPRAKHPGWKKSWRKWRLPQGSFPSSITIQSGPTRKRCGRKAGLCWDSTPRSG